MLSYFVVLIKAKIESLKCALKSDFNYVKKMLKKKNAYFSGTYLQVAAKVLWILSQDLIIFLYKNV